MTSGEILFVSGVRGFSFVVQESKRGVGKFWPLVTRDPALEE